LPVNLRPAVEVARPPKTLIWSVRLLGTAGRHAFYLEPRPNGTLVRERLNLDGGGLTLLRLLRFDRALAVSIHDNLRGLRRLAERG
jgi:hypothetical protein